MGCKGYRTGCGGAREGGGNKVGECKAGRRRNIFFIIYLQCFPLKGWRPKRWKPIFMCVAYFYTQCFVDNLD